MLPRPRRDTWLSMNSLREAPELLSVGEVALLLRCSSPTVYRRVQAGEIPAIRLGSGRAALRIPRAELEEWLERHVVPA
jgi:excisionase family DNA binding protein